MILLYYIEENVFHWQVTKLNFMSISIVLIISVQEEKECLMGIHFIKTWSHNYSKIHRSFSGQSEFS